MALSAVLEKYKRLLVQLLPPGRLWQPRAQPTFDKLLESTAQELCRVDGRVKDMKREIDPTVTSELLPDWERFLALPDECTPDNLTPDERRQQLVQKLTNVGGLSASFFEFIGAQLGFDIDVENCVNFIAGRARAGDPLCNYFDRHFVAGSVAGTQLAVSGWRYFFLVTMPADATQHFVAGSTAGEPLVLFSNPLIECTIRKLKPAHAGVSFRFK